MNPGSIVRCRNRDWLLLPSDEPEFLLLRPLTGATDEGVAVHRSDMTAYLINNSRSIPTYLAYVREVEATGFDHRALRRIRIHSAGGDLKLC